MSLLGPFLWRLGIYQDDAYGLQIDAYGLHTVQALSDVPVEFRIRHDVEVLGLDHLRGLAVASVEDHLGGPDPSRGRLLLVPHDLDHGGEGLERVHPSRNVRTFGGGSGPSEARRGNPNALRRLMALALERSLR